MNDKVELLEAARAALERRPEINLHAYPIDLSVEDGALVMRGEVENIIAKRLARRELTVLFGSDRVLDRLRVIPGESRGDGQIAAAVDGALRSELAFRDYRVTAGSGNHVPRTRSETVEHNIVADVQDAELTLEGVVGSLSHKRLADILGWWTPGVCAVENHLQVWPAERDSDAEISDALRMVLEKDPWLDAAQIAVQVTDRRVILEGLVPGEEQKSMAAQDAWYVLGVHDVDNRLHVQIPGAS